MANPARPTVSNPATLTPVGYLQFETGVLAATDSPEFSTRYEWNEVVKLAVSRRLELIESSEPLVHYTAGGITANGTDEVFFGGQFVLMPGEGAKPTLAISYSHRAYDGGAPELDFGSPQNSSVFYASADVKGSHYDANAIFNEVLEGGVHRLQFGQTISISHPITKGFAVSGEIWRFTHPSCAAMRSRISGPQLRGAQESGLRCWLRQRIDEQVHALGRVRRLHLLAAPSALVVGESGLPRPM